MLLNFSSWNHWVGSLDWSRRWFVFLILVRPIVDNFYYLKRISPFYSPLYIIGIITPILIVFILFFNRSKPLIITVTDKLFILWSFFLCLNCLFLICSQTTLVMLGHVFKALTPVYLYFFLRYFIRSRNDLEKILQTVVYAALIVASIVLYETIFSSINTQISRGIERSYGGYADVFNYAIYFILTVLIFGYYLLNHELRGFLRKEKLTILIVFMICILGLIRIAHAATYGVFVAIIFAFLWNGFRLNKVRGIVLLFVFFVVFYFIFHNVGNERIYPLFRSEISVIEGKRSIDGAFHGRASRWIRYWDYYKKMPTLVQFLGVPIGQSDKSMLLTGGGNHNDFLRILFLSGVLGLISYLSILINLLIRSVSFPNPMRFLVIGSLIIIIFYSTSALPMLYNSLLYVVLSVIAYTNLCGNRKIRLVFYKSR